ncbi:MAG: peptidoglycan editing factor PgeF [bacterium]
MLRFIKLPILNNIPTISLGFGLRYKNTIPDISLKTLAINQLAQNLNQNSISITFLKQVHGDKIVYLKTNNHKDVHLAEADALLTDSLNKCLVIVTADCLPVILFDKKLHIISIIHAGWRGTSLGITSKAILKMVTEFGSKPDDILVGIGPCIDQCCYEVDEPVISIFEKQFANKKNFFIKIANNDSHYRLSLKKVNKYQAVSLSVPEKNIITSPLCTYCNPHLFFSYRRDGQKAGRMVNFIILKQP